jgi:hypothetical protein
VIDTPPELAGAVFEATIRSKAAELKSELIRQTLEDGDSWERAIRTEYEKAYPGESAGSEPVPATISEVKAWHRTVQDDYYEWVEPAFERYLTPDPDAGDPVIETLRTIESMFGGSQDHAGGFTAASPALTRINDARADMNQWEGHLQINFIDNFLTPLQSASVSQAAIAKFVREQFECNKILHIRRRKGILRLVNDSIEAVQTLTNGRDPETYMWGTLVGISLGTGLTLAPGGIAVAGAALIISSTLAQGIAPDPDRTTTLSAPTAQEVAINVVEAMNCMDRDTDEQERHVEAAFKSIYTTIANSRSGPISNNASGQLAVAVPELSTASPADIVDGSLHPRE